ncbi:MAG: cytochrome c maturation protein CcmE [Deltaproteobacteria bacterium]|nr:cytochrome c maturation protein CcmE [Deltaproteobacteria bacterium]
MKKKILILLGVVLIAGGLAYTLWGGLEQNLVYFVTPTELIQKGDAAIGNPVRLGGVVAEGSLHVTESEVNFQIADDHHRVSVVSHVTPPQMFQEGIGAVVEGALQKDKKFLAERLMVKHGNEYRPPEEGKMPQQIYQQLLKK